MKFTHLTHDEAVNLLERVWPEVEAFRAQSDEAFREKQRHARTELRLMRRIEQLEHDLKQSGRVSS